MSEARPTPLFRSGTGLFLGSLLSAGIVSAVLLHQPEWPREAAFMAGIFVLAALLWVTEALPLFATALLVVGLELLLLANPGHWPGLGFADAGKSPGYREILSVAADPALFLFFGGFLMARAAVKEGVDRAMSSLLLKPFGRRPLLLVLGLMLVTALFSMWMSNTATTSMMIALLVPILAQIPRSDPYRRLLVLCIPFAAAIGGISTPISSPPNAVAIGFLQKAGRPIYFLDWMLVTMPLIALLLLFTWGLLCLLFRPKTKGLRIAASARPLTRRGWFVVAVFTLTVLFWISDQWHGLPAAIVAVFPTVALTASRILDRRDVDGIEWNILILIAGGIALGNGIAMSGLDAMIAHWLPSSPDQVFLLSAVMIAIMLVLGTFMSNTAAANLLLPLGMSSATAAGGEAPVVIAVSIALSASFAIALPVSTPPNAIAYGTGEISVRDMALPGIVLGLVAGALILFFCEPVLRFWGL